MGIQTNNNVDFRIAIPTPQGSGGVLATNENANKSIIKKARITDNFITFANNVENVKIYSFTGQVVMTDGGKKGSKLNIANLIRNYIITTTVNNKIGSQKFLKE